MILPFKRLFRPLNRTIEILESRIAPALFFVSGTNLTIVDDTSAHASAINALAATTAGATAAVDLHAGDTLVFDANGDHKLDAGRREAGHYDGAERDRFFQ